MQYVYSLMCYITVTLGFFFAKGIFCAIQWHSYTRILVIVTTNVKFQGENPSTYPKKIRLWKCGNDMNFNSFFASVTFNVSLSPFIGKSFGWVIRCKSNVRHYDANFDEVIHCSIVFRLIQCFLSLEKKRLSIQWKKNTAWLKRTPRWM